MTRALVTGASGFIGRQVATVLAQKGIEVHGCARTPSAPHGVTMHVCDLLDHAAAEALLGKLRVDILVHCAWVTTHGAYWQSPKNLDWLAASVTLLRLAKDAGMRRFVGVGTCAEYDPAAGDPRHEQRSPIAPSTLYGTAKDSLRRIAERYAAVQGIECAWARIFMLYGEGEHPDRLVASLARALVSGRPARMASGGIVRDFLDVRDAGAAIAALAASRLQGPVNIGSGEAIALRALGEQLAAIAGRPELLFPGAIPDRAGEPGSLVADVARLRVELGFRSSISLEQGLSDVLDYWREHAPRV